MHSHTPMPATQSTGAVQPATNELATLQAKKKTVRKKKASSATATPTVTPAPPSLPPNLAQMSTSEFQAAIYELVLRQATALESISQNISLLTKSFDTTMVPATQILTEQSGAVVPPRTDTESTNVDSNHSTTTPASKKSKEVIKDTMDADPTASTTKRKRISVPRGPSAFNLWMMDQKAKHDASSNEKFKMTSVSHLWKEVSKEEQDIYIERSKNLKLEHPDDNDAASPTTTAAEKPKKKRTKVAKPSTSTNHVHADTDAADVMMEVESARTVNGKGTDQAVSISRSSNAEDDDDDDGDNGGKDDGDNNDNDDSDDDVNDDTNGNVALDDNSDVSASTAALDDEDGVSASSSDSGDDDDNASDNEQSFHDALKSVAAIPAEASDSDSNDSDEEEENHRPVAPIMPPKVVSSKKKVVMAAAGNSQKKSEVVPEVSMPSKIKNSAAGTASMSSSSPSITKSVISTAKKSVASTPLSSSTLSPVKAIVLSEGQLPANMINNVKKATAAAVVGSEGSPIVKKPRKKDKIKGMK